MKGFKGMVGLIAGLLLMAPCLSAHAAEGKIGYVDLSKLFDEYYKTKEYDKLLEGKFNKFQDDMKLRVDKIKDQDAKLSLLTDDKKKTATDELEKMKSEAVEYEKNQKITHFFLPIDSCFTKKRINY